MTILDAVVNAFKVVHVPSIGAELTSNAFNHGRRAGLAGLYFVINAKIAGCSRSILEEIVPALLDAFLEF